MKGAIQIKFIIITVNTQFGLYVKSASKPSALPGGLDPNSSMLDAALLWVLSNNPPELIT